jgi:hypothetical protein
MRKQNPGRSLRCVVGVCASVVLVGVTAAPAPAQYLNYLPWSLGSSLLYPLRMFGGYSANGMSGYSNPAWYGGGVLQRMSRGSGGLGYGGYDPNGNPNFYEINNDDPNNLNNPNNPNNPNNQYQSNGQGNQAPPYNQAYQPAPTPVLRYGAPIYQPKPKKSKKNSQNNSQNYQPNYSQGGNQYSPPGNQYSANGQAPGQVAYNCSPGYASNQSVPSQAQAGNLSSPALSAPYAMPVSQLHAGGFAPMSAPFAVSFINVVNEKYDGDIRRALANPQTKAWASSLGLVDSAQVGKATLSEERVGVIGRILHDSTLDPVSKLEAIKILLRS